MPGPALPQQQKKKAASSNALPINHAQYITLADGKQVPVMIPPGMPAEQAQGILEYLKTNPEAAKAAWAQAQAIMASPGLASAFTNLSTQQQDPAKSAQVYEALKDDPELSHVFEEVTANGPAALQKFWDDTELMSKISAKLRDMRLSEQQAAAAAGKPPAKGAGKPLSEAIVSLHDGAKWGDVEACERLLAEGADVNGLNERGISALGVAVGFNQKAVVSLLLERGADLAARDAAGNTVLHYAAGYGRIELLKLLVEQPGADVTAANKQKQQPVDVARVNKEKHVVAFLEQLGGGEEGDNAEGGEASKPAIKASS